MDALVRLLLTNAAAAGVIALLAWAAGRTLRRPAVVHGLWLLALVKLVTPPIAPLPLLPAWSLDAVLARTTPTVAAIPASAVPPRPVAPRLEAPRTTVDVEVVALRRSDPRPASPPAPPRTPLDWRRVAGPGVALGALGLALLAAWRFGRFARLLEHARPAPGPLVARVADLSAKLGLRQAPPVRLLPAPVPPMLWPHPSGARLLLPADLIAALRGDELDALLAHELAHLRRRDHWVRPVELAATALFWWYPVAWWARSALRRAEERCCDEWVLRVLPGSAEAYANGILKSLALVTEGRAALPALASGAGPVDDLEVRLKEILMTRPLPKLPVPVRLALAAAALAGLAVFPTTAETRTAASDAAAPSAPVVAPAPPAGTPAAAPAPAQAAARPAPAARPALAPAPQAPSKEKAASPERRAFEEQRRALDEQRRKLHQQEMELARKQVELEAQAELTGLRKEAERLRAAGRTEEAARLESHARIVARRTDLQKQQLSLEAERMAVEAKLEAELEARHARLEAVAEGEERREDVERELRAARAAREEAVREIERQHERLAGEASEAEREARLAAAEDQVRAMREATEQVARSLAEQMESLREILANDPARKADLEREMKRLQSALEALRSTATPGATPTPRP